MSSIFSHPALLDEARKYSLGYLALAFFDSRLSLCVCKRGNDYYIGTLAGKKPLTRESESYYPTRQEALKALESGQWIQRFFL